MAARPATSSGSNERRRHRPRQRECQKGQQRRLERPHRAEILRAPFADARKVLDAHEAEGKRQRLEAVRIDEGGDHRRACESRPGPRRRKSAARLGLEHGLGGEGNDEREPEDEAAMQVRPEDHQRREPVRRRAAPVARLEQADDPEGHHRQGQHMRAREQARNPEPDPERRDDPERRAFEVAGDAQAHDERRAARRKARQDDDAAPTRESGRPARTESRRAIHARSRAAIPAPRG